jgi:hypothetical protein
VEDRPPSEAELVSRARRGDDTAFGGLVALHEEVAFRTAYLVLALLAAARAYGPSSLTGARASTEPSTRYVGLDPARPRWRGPATGASRIL